jgi:hypothetical protein
VAPRPGPRAGARARGRFPGRRGGPRAPRSAAGARLPLLAQRSPPAGGVGECAGTLRPRRSLPKPTSDGVGGGVALRSPVPEARSAVPLKAPQSWAVVPKFRTAALKRPRLPGSSTREALIRGPGTRGEGTLVRDRRPAQWDLGCLCPLWVRGTAAPRLRSANLPAASREDQPPRRSGSRRGRQAERGARRAGRLSGAGEARAGGREPEAAG